MLRDAIGHHLWATTNQLDVCATLSADELATEVPGTYGTILDTLRHLVAADCSYLSVISGGRFGDTDARWVPARRRPSSARSWTTNAEGWDAVLADDDLDEDRDLVRHRPDGTSTHAKLGIRLAQVVHHSSDHRSQVNTALTTLGRAPEEFDVWAYGESVGRCWDG